MRLTHLLMSIAGAFVLAAVLFPLFATAETGGRGHSHCLSNVKQQGMGLLMYAEDANDRLPLRDAWMDGALPYVRSEDVYNDPEGPKQGYGYAFNASLSLAKTTKLEEPADVPMTYDSVNPIRNASDAVASLPAKGRHPAKKPTTNSVGYADGHAKPKRMVP